jgi:hypothetical protein
MRASVKELKIWTLHYMRKFGRKRKNEGWGKITCSLVFDPHNQSRTLRKKLKTCVKNFYSNSWILNRIFEQTPGFLIYFCEKIDKMLDFDAFSEKNVENVGF